MKVANPLGLAGIGFLEFASPTPAKLATLWRDFGFSRTHEHRNYSIEVWRQNAITLLVNEQRGSFAEQFAQQHGPSIPSMGWLCEDAERAFRVAVQHGARPYEYETPIAAPAVYGVGNSLIHFIEAARWQENFTQLRQPEIVPQKGLHSIDHLTIKVLHGTLATWVDFHKQVFGFTEVHAPRTHGNHKTPQPHALRSPDGSFCIAINESSEENGQIEEYLHAYKGAGIRHLAFRTNDLLKSLDALRGTSITTLTIDDAYYADVFKRVPKTREEQQRIKAHGVLVDGDVTSNLLQAFTPPLIGPIFIELIEHENHPAFGSGNSWNVVTLEGA